MPYQELTALVSNHQETFVHSGPSGNIKRLNDLLEHQRVSGKNLSINEVLKMNDSLLRRRQVEEVTGLSRSSIYRLMMDHDFPRPVRIGPAAVRWRSSDLTAWLESRPVATGDFGRPKAARVMS